MSETKVEIEKVVPGGWGLARDGDGVVLVPRVVSGERVTIRRFEKYRGTRRAADFVVDEASPDRVAPDCAVHPACGGCGLLDFAPARQREAKVEMILDGLARTAKLEDLSVVEPMRFATGDEARRRRCRLTVDGAGRVGFLGAASHDVVEHETCPALTETLNAAVGRVKAALSARVALKIRLAHDDQGHVSAALEGREAQGAARDLVAAGAVHGAVVEDDGEVVARFGDPALAGEVAPGAAGGPFGSDAATFTQASRFAGRAIAEEVLRHLSLAGFGGGPVIELFAGAGHLTFPLATVSEQVLAIEGNARAALHLRDNADRAGLEDQVRTVWGHIDGETFPNKYAELIEVLPEALVLDPPRTGTSRFDILLDTLQPDIVVLVSCDIATGARDIRLALDRGYELCRVTPIDAFARTPHVEWVASLMLPYADEDEDEDATDGAPP